MKRKVRTKKSVEHENDSGSVSSWSSVYILERKLKNTGINTKITELQKTVQGLFKTFIGCDYLTLVALFLKKSFSLEIVKNGICLGGPRKQSTLF